MKKIAVIGAGASGLPAIKCCLDEGLQPVCFERTEDIGGLWNWRENPTDGRSTVMKSTIINSSKETSFYSDFLVPEDYPNYMHNKKVLNYFRLYAENFDLMKCIHFRTEVKRVSQGENFKETGRWKLELKDLESGLTRTEEFDGVMVCSGHHTEKKVVHFPGQEEFEGKIVHTHDYTDHQGYEGKRVIVVGIGNSGADVSVELSKVCDQINSVQQQTMKKIAIIGAGASGLPVIKCCLDEGLQPVCFERTEDIGGLWNWKETPTDGRTTVMKSTIINSSKETSFYSDFLVPADYPNYMHNKKVLSYFRLYAKNFDLMKCIHFRTEVKRVSQVENFEESGRWKLEIKDLESGLTRTEEFDGVMVLHRPPR